MLPMVIFDRKKITQALRQGEVPNSYYGSSKRGWMGTKLFQDWFIEHFLSYSTRKRPILLRCLWMDIHCTIPASPTRFASLGWEFARRYWEL